MMMKSRSFVWIGLWLMIAPYVHAQDEPGYCVDIHAACSISCDEDKVTCEDEYKNPAWQCKAQYSRCDAVCTSMKAQCVLNSTYLIPTE